MEYDFWIYNPFLWTMKAKQPWLQQYYPTNSNELSNNLYLLQRSYVDVINWPNQIYSLIQNFIINNIKTFVVFFYFSRHETTIFIESVIQQSKSHWYWYFYDSGNNVKLNIIIYLILKTTCCRRLLWTHQMQVQNNELKINWNQLKQFTFFCNENVTIIKFLSRKITISIDFGNWQLCHNIITKIAQW